MSQTALSVTSLTEILVNKTNFQREGEERREVGDEGLRLDLEINKAPRYGYTLRQVPHLTSECQIFNDLVKLHCCRLDNY